MENRHFTRAPVELKLGTIRRRFIDGELVHLVSDKIGYTPSSIYTWYQCYQEKVSLSFMKKPDSKAPADKKRGDALGGLKAQMLDM